MNRLTGLLLLGLLGCVLISCEVPPRERADQLERACTAIGGRIRWIEDPAAGNVTEFHCTAIGFPKAWLPR